MLGSILKKVVRDNEYVNPIVRNVLKFASRRFLKLKPFVFLYRFFGVAEIAVLGTIFRIYSEADDLIANELYYGIEYERKEFKFLTAAITHASFFVDIGANTGIFSIFCATRKSGTRIVCVEPYQNNFNRLKVNLSLNGINPARLVCAAVGCESGKIKFTVPADERISATSSVRGEFTRAMHDIPYQDIEVDLVTIDELLSDLPISTRDIIKIDVESYELEALKGALSTLSKGKPTLIVEILEYHRDNVNSTHEQQGPVENVLHLLQGIGYHCFLLSDHGLVRIEQLEGNERNFVFLPLLQPRDGYTFHEIGQGQHLEKS